MPINVAVVPTTVTVEEGGRGHLRASTSVAQSWRSIAWPHHQCWSSRQVASRCPSHLQERTREIRLYSTPLPKDNLKKQQGRLPARECMQHCVTKPRKIITG
jgi:hypothetical protein